MVGTEARTFARPGVVRQGWYLVARSSQLRCGQVKPIDVGSRRLIVYRDRDGRAHVTDDRCPHLGSDLALARVVPQGLLCEFHGWCWGADGSCVAAPGNPTPNRRRLRRYASEERWGFIWAWTGCEPAFPLPAVPAHLGRQVVLLPHRLNAHPDVIFSNGFDLAHFGPSHGIEASTASLDVGPWTIDHRIVGRLSKRKTLRFVGLAGTELDFSFVQYGGGIVHVHVRKPIEYLIFFTLRQDAQFRARTRTMLFLRRRTDLPRALAVLWSTALDDLRMMERIHWTGAFAPADAALERYAGFVEALPLASGLSSLNKDQIAERGAWLARRDDREYGEYLREEQRSQPGCPAREGVLDQRGQATSPAGAPASSSYGGSEG